MKCCLVFTLSVICCIGTTSGTLLAQPDSLWSRNYGGHENDEPFSVIQANDDGFIAAGWSNSFGDSQDMYVVRTDENGNMEWAETYGGEGDESCHTILQADSGNYILAGYTSSFGAGSYDFYLVKIDEDGEVIWMRTYGTEMPEKCISAIRTDDGYYILGGSSGQDEELRMYCIKVTSAGDSVWARTYDLAEGCVSIIPNIDDGYILTGDGFSIVKIDTCGEEQWSQSYEVSELSYSCNTSIVTVDDIIILGGWIEIFYEGWSPPYWYFIWVDEHGELLSADTLEDHEELVDGECAGLIATDDGGFVIAGTSGWALGANFFLAHINERGQYVWNRYFRWFGDQSCLCVIPTSDGGFLMAGYEEFGRVAGRKDFLLLRTGPDPVNVPRLQDTILPDNFPLLPAYPNPFNCRTIISYQLNRYGFVTLKVYDRIGRIVANLYEGPAKPGLYNAVWDAGSVPTGVYMVRLTDGIGRMESRSIVMVK